MSYIPIIKGVQQRNWMFTKDCFDKHRSIVHFFRSAHDNAFLEGFVSEPSNRLIRSVDLFAIVPCVLLSLFGIRWSDAIRLDLQTVATRKRFKIIQAKTSKDFFCNNKYIPSEFLDQSFPSDTPLICCTYDHVRKQITKHRRFTGIKMPRACLDETHIFRHLTASWLHHIKTPFHLIQKRLGHLNPDSTRAYIHEWEEIFKLN